MAKFGSLTLESGKIVDNAINMFFEPTDDTHITMANSSGGPNLIYLQIGSSGGSLTRNSDSKLLLVQDDYDRTMVVDDAPGASETYSYAGSGKIIGGVVRLK